MLPSRKITAAFVGVFLIGAMVGALVMMSYTDTRLLRFMDSSGDPDAMAAAINQKYIKQYNLTPDEQNRIGPIVREMTEHLYQERHQFGSQVIVTLDDYHQKIRELMTPEQRAAYDKVNDERKKWMSSRLLEQTSGARGQK